MKKRLALSWFKKLYALLRGITSIHEGDFYTLNCFHMFRIEKKHKDTSKAFDNLKNKPQKCMK